MLGPPDYHRVNISKRNKMYTTKWQINDDDRCIGVIVISKFVISGLSLYRSSLYRGYRYIEVRYIGVIVISKFVISGFFPIHFTATFAGTSNFHRYTGNIEDRYRGSTAVLHW